MKESVNIDELNAIAGKLKQYAAVENERLLQDVAEQLNRKPNLAERLFPSAIQKEKNQITVQTLRMLHKDKEKFFEFYSAVRLEIAGRLSKALIASVGMDLHAKLAKFANEKITELTETLAINRKGFMERMKPQFSALEDYRDLPEIYEPAYASLKNEIAIYFASVDALLNGFSANLEAKASQSEA